jgi:hypothetical protein
VVLHHVLQDKRRSTATSSGGGASATATKGRHTQGQDEGGIGEGLSLQSPELMPHILIEVRAASREPFTVSQHVALCDKDTLSVTP